MAEPPAADGEGELHRWRAPRRDGGRLVTLHVALAVLTAGLALVVAAVTIVGAIRHATLRFAIDRAILATEAAVALALLAGLPELATTPGPRDGLHLVYAVVALGALPAGRAWRGFAQGPRPMPIGIACVVLLGVLVRLAQTG
jgi:hypothetical protein